MESTRASTEFYSPITLPIVRRAVFSPVPLADGQRTCWEYMARFGSRMSHRMRATAIRVLGPLDVGALDTSVQLLIRRHESLRTQLTFEGPAPSQQTILECVPVPLETVSLEDVTKANAEEAAKDSCHQFLNRPIDLSTDQLFGAMLLKLSPSEHVLVLSLDHMVGDGISCGIVSRELWSIYDCIVQNLPPSLADLPIQFPDYAVWQNQTLGDRRALHEPYWRARARNAPTMAPPLLDQTDDSHQQESAVLHVPLGNSISSKLRALAHREKTLLPLVVLAAHVLVMSKWCHEPDFVFPFVSHGRFRRAQLQNMVGCLSQLLYCRIQISASESLLDLLKRTHAEFIAATEHQDFAPPHPPDSEVHLAFNWGGLVVYSARWSVQQQRKASSQLRIQPFRLETDKGIGFIAAYSDTPAGIVATLRYAPARVSHIAVAKLAQNLRLVLGAYGADPGSQVGSLPFEEPAE